jgi:hypothetical protein
LKEFGWDIRCSESSGTYVHGVSAISSASAFSRDLVSVIFQALSVALASLLWARANGCVWDEDTCFHAAAGGHLAILQWARANGCAWNRADCLESASTGSETRDWIQAQPA